MTSPLPRGQQVALLTGERVAWSTRQNGRTTGLSSVHRVYDGINTYCSQVIPGEYRRNGLAPLFGVLHECKRCERMYAQASLAEQEGQS